MCRGRVEVVKRRSNAALSEYVMLIDVKRVCRCILYCTELELLLYFRFYKISIKYKIMPFKL